MALRAGYVAPTTAIETDRNFVEEVFGIVSGVMDVADFVVTPGTGLQVAISTGAAVLHGTDATDQGDYFVFDKATSTKSWPAPSASQRIDSLVLRVADSQYGSLSGAAGPRWDVVQGTPGSGSAPTDTVIGVTNHEPGAWLRVADVTVPVAAGSFVSGNISRKAQVIKKYTTVHGPGTPVVVAAASSALDMNSLVIPAVPWDRWLSINAGSYVVFSQPADTYLFQINAGGSAVTRGGANKGSTQQTVESRVAQGQHFLAANATVTLTYSAQRTFGSGTGTSIADVNQNYINAIGVPA